MGVFVTRHRMRVAMLIVAMTAALPSVAAPPADLSAPLQAVHRFVAERAAELGDEVAITIREPRAPLPECTMPAPFLPNANARPIGRISVGVRCEDTGQVRYLQAQVSVMGRYIELSQRLVAGETVRAEHLTEKRGDLARLPDTAILDPGVAIGQEATRTLAAGATLQDHHLRRPRLVRRGQAVIVEARGTGFRITREAEAMEPGGKGDSVRVRLDGREIIRARVVGERRLAVDP
jgi:flagella basal body P-ring formation protein FlgA